MGGAPGSMDSVVAKIENLEQLPGGGKGIDKASVTEVFLFGLPPDTTALHLFKMMAPLGAIMKAKDNPSVCRGFGFVNFLSDDAADQAIQVLNGIPMSGGKTLKVEKKSAGRAAGGGIGGGGGD